jgi:hypothetical protein
MHGRTTIKNYIYISNVRSNKDETRYAFYISNSVQWYIRKHVQDGGKFSNKSPYSCRWEKCWQLIIEQNFNKAIRLSIFIWHVISCTGTADKAERTGRQCFWCFLVSACGMHTNSRHNAREALSNHTADRRWKYMLWETERNIKILDLFPYKYYW